MTNSKNAPVKSMYLTLKENNDETKRCLSSCIATQA